MGINTSMTHYLRKKSKKLHKLMKSGRMHKVIKAAGVVPKKEKKVATA